VVREGGPSTARADARQVAGRVVQKRRLDATGVPVTDDVADILAVRCARAKEIPAAVAQIDVPALAVPLEERAVELGRARLVLEDGVEVRLSARDTLEPDAAAIRQNQLGPLERVAVA